MLSPKEAIQILVKDSESEFLRKTEFLRKNEFETMSYRLEKLLTHPKYTVLLLYKGEPLSGGEYDNPYWVLDFHSDNFVTQMDGILDDDWKQCILDTSEAWLTFDLTRHECVDGLISYLKAIK